MCTSVFLLLFAICGTFSLPASEYSRTFFLEDVGNPNTGYFQAPRGVDYLKQQQHRRGSQFDSLLPGSAFGRAARSDKEIDLKLHKQDGQEDVMGLKTNLGRIARNENLFNDKMKQSATSALDILGVGNGLGRRSEDSETELTKETDNMERTTRNLNSLSLGQAFGRALRRYSLDSLGGHAFGTAKRNYPFYNTPLKTFMD